MTRRRGTLRAGWWPVAAASLALALPCGTAAGDPLADEIARWSAFVREHPAGDDTWNDVKASAEPVLAKAQDALAAGRRALALDRLAAVRTNLAAQAFVDRSAAPLRSDMIALEAEWARVGRDLGPSLAAPSRSALVGVVPAAARAEAEAALMQIRGFYDAVLDYARATEPQYGLFYLGQAQAQRDFVAFCRALPPQRVGKPLAPRSIKGEIDALNREMLAAYRPPASIDRHGEFILAHSLVNEARQLDAAGLRYGALLRYLQAAMRSASLRGVTPVPAEALPARLAAFDASLAKSGVDGSLGRLFLEAAQANADLGPLIAADVFPRYAFAIGRAPAPMQARTPQVTVTLVRWPYT